MNFQDQFGDNPLIQADRQFRQQQPQAQRETLPSQDELVQLGKEGKISHMGGKLPDFLKGIISEARDAAKKVMRGGDNVIEFDNSSETTPNEPLDTERVYTALSGHESRGAEIPGDTIATDTGATGTTQITPIMVTQYNQITGGNVAPEQLVGNEQLQKEMTGVLVNDIMTKYDGGLDEDWPTHTKKLTEYKKEIKSKFNEPIYWLAGEWVAGPNWVSKLDSPTAKGATETVRDYIQRVADIYNNQTNSLTLNK